MKQKKLLEKLKAFFDSDARERDKQKSDIKDILKKLKKKERNLKEKFDAEDDVEKRNRIQQKIDVIYAQRKKGIKLIKEQ
jgi:predicted nucleotidyltransferase